jgi:hypothetical protein
MGEVEVLMETSNSYAGSLSGWPHGFRSDFEVRRPDTHLPGGRNFLEGAFIPIPAGNSERKDRLFSLGWFQKLSLDSGGGPEIRLWLICL